MGGESKLGKMHVVRKRGHLGIKHALLLSTESPHILITMKGLLSVICLSLLVATGCKQDPPRQGAGANTLSSFDLPTTRGKIIPAQSIKFDQAAVEQALNLYAEISGRSVIRVGNLPEAKITFSNQGAMSSVEALQALDTVLAAQGIAMVVFGAQYVKAVPAKEANLAGGPVFEGEWERLPESSSFLIYIVKVKSGTAMNSVPALAPFATLPNSVISVGAGSGRQPSKSTIPQLSSSLFGTEDDVIILRDYSSSVRRMLQVLGKVQEAK